MPRENKRLSFLSRTSLALGLVLTAIQLALAISLAPTRGFSASYLKLCAWDCGWYSEIAREGYHSTIPPVAQRSSLANVAFFPGYPYLGRAAYLGLGVKPEIALLVIAQLMCVIFWATLWELLCQWKIPHSAASLVIFAVFCHPAAFFLVAGYSESLFLSSLLIFILTALRPRIGSSWPLSISGFAMSATRIVGIPAAGYPLIARFTRSFARRKLPDRALLLSPIAASANAIVGALLFFAFCKARFGHFGLYMETQKIGWGIQPDYGALWKWDSFSYALPWDRWATLASGWGFLALLVLESGLLIFSRTQGFSRRFPIYLTAFAIFFITLSGLKSQSFKSMIRYTLPWYILLLLCLTHLWVRTPWAAKMPKLSVCLIWLIIASGLIGLFTQVELPHFREYLRGGWFA